MINRIEDIATRMRVAGQLCQWFVDTRENDDELTFYHESRDMSTNDLPIVVGDWNDDQFKVLGDALQSIGATCDWSDQSASCGDCLQHIETEPTWFGWLPKWEIRHSDYICHECIRDNWRNDSLAGEPLWITPDGATYQGPSEDRAILICDIPDNVNDRTLDEWLDDEDRQAQMFAILICRDEVERDQLCRELRDELITELEIMTDDD